MYVYVCMCVCMYIEFDVLRRKAFSHTLHICMCVYMYGCMSGCVFVSVLSDQAFSTCVCVCVPHTHTHIYIYIHIYIYMLIYICPHFFVLAGFPLFSFSATMRIVHMCVYVFHIYIYVLTCCPASWSWQVSLCFHSQRPCV
jgi:hypothetical protein